MPKHRLPVPNWPTVEEASSAKLFHPIPVGPVTLEQRTWVPAMVPWRCTEEGFVTDDILSWYRRFAEGRPGAIVVEATGIRDIASGPLMRIGHDRFIPGLKKLVDTVREASGGHTRLFIQLIDFLTVRRRPEKEKYLRKFFRLGEEIDRDRLLTLSDDELKQEMTDREWEDLQFGYRERVTDTHLDHIRDLPNVLPGAFAEAAARAVKAGFDGVELHFAHAYTMSSFLSALNTRNDDYGGSKENRIRLPLEVFGAVRDAVHTDRSVGCRMLAEDCVEGGSTLGDSSWFAVEFAKAGLDFLSLSRGGRFEDAKQPQVGQAVYPYTGPSGHECMPTIREPYSPFARNVEASSAIRKAVRDAGYDTPIVTAGGICTFNQAEKILLRGDADIIGSARQSLADPDWFRKTQLGRGREVRRCEYTNYCEGLDQKHKKVTCRLWDTADAGDASTEDGRRLIAPSWNDRD
jgi:2,4-dienoyl-CoA reductase-like NADH-dependent reductase (Old Yellow Enzyme family)